MNTQRKPRLVWHDRSDAEISKGSMPHLPDGMIHGWMTMDGTVYAGEGYPVSRGLFVLDTAQCSAILIARTETQAAVVEKAAEALGLHRFPGGDKPYDPPTRWPADEQDTLSGRDGTVPLTWEFAEKCREDVRIVMAALGSCATTDTGDLISDLTDFADRIDRYGFVHALGGHAATLRAAVDALNSPVRPVAWFDVTEMKPAEMNRIVVLYGDGSGGRLCYWTGEVLFDQEGEECEWPTDAGGRWAYLPAEMDLWCEMLEVDPTVFPRPNRVSA